jgi:hypothetical protein
MPFESNCQKFSSKNIFNSKETKEIVEKKEDLRKKN